MSDIAAIGPKLTYENLIAAYQNGIFPWPDPDEPEMIWACPKKRAILEFKNLHIPKSLKKVLNQKRFTTTINRDFKTVIQHCSEQPRPGQGGTWITPEMIKAYIDLHKRGIAHSIEVWEQSTLVGGLYGVAVDGVFAGESMFHLKSNASKIAVLFVAEHLLKRNCEWMDIQQLTPHMSALGAIEITRQQFLKKLSLSQDPHRVLF